MVTPFLSLTNEDIKKNKFMYSPEQIEYSLINDYLRLRILYKNQKLTPYICSKYVIFGGNEEKYGDCTEDCWIDDNNILSVQTHISRCELSEAHIFVFFEEQREYKENKLMNKEDK